MIKHKSILKVSFCLIILCSLSGFSPLKASEFNSIITRKSVLASTLNSTKTAEIISISKILISTTYLNQIETNDTASEKKVSSKKKWILTAAVLITGSVTLYLILNNGDEKAKIPTPPSRPANP
jgi:hypothetical protein